MSDEHGMTDPQTPELRAPETHSPSAPGEAGATAAQPPAPASRYAMGSSANMIRSLVAILAIMVLLWFMVPRTNNLGAPAVDVHATALDVQTRSGFPLDEAVGLPDGWTARSARLVRSSSDLMTWHASWQNPQGSFIALEQTKGATTLWVESQTNRAERTGEVTAGGRTWVTMVRPNKKQNSLLHLPTEKDGVATLLTGTASVEELVEFAGYIKPVTR